MSASLKWSGCKVLITGASGFLGSHLVRELVRRDADVNGVSRTRRTRSEDGVRWWHADPAEAQEILKVFKKVSPEVVFHLSSLAHGGRDLSLVMPTFRSEVAATLNILMAAVDVRPTRLVLPGSLEEPIKGEVPSSPYAAAKAVSRLYGRMFHLLYCVPVTFTRIFMTYGPGQPDWKVIPYCIRSCLQGQNPKIGSPEREVDWIYVDDVVRGLLSLAMSYDLVGQSVDLGSGKLVSIGSLVKLIVKLTGAQVRPEYRRIPERQDETVRRANRAETLKKIGWVPSTSLAQGLERTIDSFRSIVKC